MKIESLLNKYLILEENEPDDDQEVVEPVFDMMVDLLVSLNPEDFNEKQQAIMGNILYELGLLTDDEEEDDLSENEDLFERKVMKIKRREHLALHKAYKRNKAKFKMMNKMYRKTAAYKMWKKKHKRMVKAGRTKTKKYV
jgi:hypothetical protein